VNDKPEVVYVIQAKMGGVTSLIANLLRYRRPDEFRYAAVLTDNLFDDATRFHAPLPADRQEIVEHRLSFENAYAVFRRIHRAIGRAPGVLVASDELELLACHAFDPGKAVVQIIHGNYEYYFNLARRHERVVDAFIAISRAIERRLKQELPHRANDVYYLPFGVPIPDESRRPSPVSAPLRLIYTGRLWHEQKGVFDLPEIDRELHDRHVDVTWTIVGDGPDGAEFRRRWTDTSRVTFLGNKTQAESLRTLLSHDVFVLPTRMEGFPVALMEAMATGLVPVVSDIESGVPEIVDEATGFSPKVGDVAGFADAIQNLHFDRSLLETMGRAARERIKTGFDLRERVADYQALYARYQELRRPRPRRLRPPYGSRLDQRWIPNVVVSTVRRFDRVRRSGGAKR
jgi:glycosyltransferase involved in cell wall biosynthesis